MAREIGERGMVPPKNFVERLAIVVGQAPSGRRAAELLGLAPATFTNALRSGKGLQCGTLALLHEAVGVDLNWLICGDGPTGNIQWPKDPVARSRRRVPVRSMTMRAAHTLPPRKSR